ncbi:hypothetical protein P280DRAFT_3060 [Massarina eburnea CBS 473.64]|uniref:Uncharacterized protein n=1 Tax=Massarina eburnea CBS 473.64 TaxID=1395130 RepID=A0A6A6SID5_9PLEO|nr:hypothetical protein P280DRAFT_3060 [Massarina eburnea CBS 473.64]
MASRSFRVDARSVPDFSPWSPNRPTRCSQGLLRIPLPSEHYLIISHVTIGPGRNGISFNMFLSHMLLESCQPGPLSLRTGPRGLFQEGAPWGTHGRHGSRIDGQSTRLRRRPWLQRYRGRQCMRESALESSIIVIVIIVIVICCIYMLRRVRSSRVLGIRQFHLL